ncbi:unnamed protein product [Closterium sp. NIES-64]|nr:unnamed protein product [Closterium sp. NIES-64]
MLQTPRFSNPFAALPIPGGSSSESSAASADSAASPASASASPPSASAPSAFQGDAASPSAASPSAAAPDSAPSAAGSKALILLPRQRLLLVPAADSTLATPADVITVVDAGSRKDPSVELIPGPAGDAGPSAVIPGPRVVTWSKLAGWRVELPPNLPDLTKLRPDIEKLRPALEARVQHTLSHVPFRELLEEIQQWSKARGGIGGWAEGSARGARRYPNKQKLSSVQDFFQYAEAEGTSLVHGSPELDKGGDGQVQLEPSPPLPPPQPPNPTVTSGGCTRGSVKRTGGESMQQQRATANVGSKGTEVSRTWGTHVRRAKLRPAALCRARQGRDGQVKLEDLERELKRRRLLVVPQPPIPTSPIPPHPPHPSGRRLFAELDKDGDGQVKLEDLEGAFKLLP